MKEGIFMFNPKEYYLHDFLESLTLEMKECHAKGIQMPILVAAQVRGDSSAMNLTNIQSHPGWGQGTWPVKAMTMLEDKIVHATFNSETLTLDPVLEKLGTRTILLEYDSLYRCEALPVPGNLTIDVGKGRIKDLPSEHGSDAACTEAFPRTPDACTGANVHDIGAKGGP